MFAKDSHCSCHCYDGCQGLLSVLVPYFIFLHFVILAWIVFVFLFAAKNVLRVTTRSYTLKFKLRATFLPLTVKYSYCRGKVYKLLGLFRVSLRVVVFDHNFFNAIFVVTSWRLT